MPRVHSPRAGYDGVSVGVRFVDGIGETTDPAALAYFQRAGYRIERPPPPAPPAPEAPGDRASKSEWVAYVVAIGELSETEADKLTRDQLADAYRPKAS